MSKENVKKKERAESLNSGGGQMMMLNSGISQQVLHRPKAELVFRYSFKNKEAELFYGISNNKIYNKNVEMK